MNSTIIQKVTESLYSVIYDTEHVSILKFDSPSELFVYVLRLRNRLKSLWQSILSRHHVQIQKSQFVQTIVIPSFRDLVSFWKRGDL
ncbi:hypothetical protein CEXT_714701 [Caerostris extrusa]|uniref:Maturase K n=1 Tax=Caerostris extrusa TaxID=172846 RepID=A0AAV4PQW1_CAEEX|nr:hypothetical protein CEXT_714701 [Caerostris extrusa]